MRRVLKFSLLISLLSLSYWSWDNYPEVRAFSQEILNIGKFQTLEVRHSAESIMEGHKRQLLIDSNHTFLEPKLRFHPYLLMEVKYTKGSDKTGEGIILWSLVDGEMVVNTRTWEKTHGFIDCITSGADRNDFKIINAIASRGNSLDREGLSKVLSDDADRVEEWLESCRKKSLIVQQGNYYRLHLENPKIKVKPETKLDHWLVTKQSKSAVRISKRFRASQIEKIAKSAFGNNFAIRKKMEVFLPVYSITVQNPDGSQMTSYWNALNGKRINQPYHIE